MDCKNSIPKLRLMTILGTRPEVIKLSEIIKKADLYFDQIIVHTGQNYDYQLNEVFFRELGIRNPDVFLGVAGKDLGETLGNVLTKAYEVISDYQPDAVLILGDTNSALSAIPAKRLKVPIFHLEAGNRCFDENLPEEINRKIVDHISDVNLAYSEHARRYLLSEGIKPQQTYVVGSPMNEVIKEHEDEINKSKVLDSLGLHKQKYFLLSAHREENIDNEENFFSLMNAINHVAEIFDLPIVYSLHPRSAKFVELRNFKFHRNVRALKPFGFFDYVKLQENAKCVISDSGTLAEESSILKFPAVSIRTSTERPEALDKGSFVIGGITTKEICQSIEVAVGLAEDRLDPVPDYLDRNVSLKVIKIIQSYVGIVDRMTWRKKIQ